eukprot:9945278-Lingulodinium_polyedra.AAC.1
MDMGWDPESDVGPQKPCFGLCAKRAVLCCKGAQDRSWLDDLHLSPRPPGGRSHKSVAEAD